MQYYKKIVSLICITALVILAIPGMQINANQSPVRVNLATDMDKYVESKQKESIEMDWKEGLIRDSNNQEVVTPEKDIKNQMPAQTGTPYTGKITYNGAMFKNEIHYFQFETVEEGTVDLTANARFQEPNTFVSTKDGSQTYKHGEVLQQVLTCS
ncbi:hypothetical protein IC619_012900 [Hazenella sp. IB182353]|uniref:hypothetical protein n=1 Tax=Polycladospora coralii TaxID=2771432 RepID=UPI0017468814|nr:hypothetical protein [Polycladospora coralii]MBS7531392.1 hypothetical protein [Polycladospora coralii]